jgi:hypothetical protein
MKSPRYNKGLMMSSTKTLRKQKGLSRRAFLRLSILSVSTIQFLAACNGTPPAPTPVVPTPPVPPPPPSATPFKVERTGQRYRTLAQAVEGAVSGDTIKVAPGTYVIPAGPAGDAPGTTWTGQYGIELETLTIEWEVFGVQPIIDLSAWVQYAGTRGGQGIGINAGGTNRSLTVRGLVLIGARVGDSYGINSNAGYQQTPANPAATLTIEYCKLVNWSDGVKTTYTNQALSLNLRYSTIEDCSEGSLTHGVYVQGNVLDVLGCTFRTTVAGNPTNAQFLGHLLKSRMKVTRVRGCLFDMRGGGAACIETPSGGDLEVYGNIILKYNMGDASNPPIKYGFEEISNFLNVTLTGAAIQVGDQLVGQTSGATGTVVALQNNGTRLVYQKTSGGTRFDNPGENILIRGVVRAVQIGAFGGSPDGTSFDGRTHRIRIAQNTIRNEQPSNYNGNYIYAIAMVWVSQNMTSDLGVPISNASVSAAGFGFVRNNIVGDLPSGQRTVADIAPQPPYPDNSPVAANTISTTGTLGALSGGAIAGSPAINDAQYAWAGEFTPPASRTDTFRGGRRATTGSSLLPTWREAMTTPLQWRSLMPAASIASLDPKDDGALNPNGAGNTPPWHNASNPQAQMLNAWGGGAYNNVTKKMVVHGGGHAGYMGNELYAIDMSEDAPKWTRLCPPSGSVPRPANFSGGNPASGSNNDVGTDERPKAVHVYGTGAQDNSGRYFQMPGGAQNTFGLGGVFTQRPFRFGGTDWDLTGAVPAYAPPQPSNNVYDPDLNVIWCAWKERVLRFDPNTLMATIFRCDIMGSAGYDDGTAYYGSASYATSQQMLLVLSGQDTMSKILVIPTANPVTGRYANTAGALPPAPSNNYYSSAWDSIRGRLLVYNGGSRIFTLTPPTRGSWVTGTWMWGELTCSTALFTPPSDNGNGIFGRFFFDHDYNCVVCQPSNVSAPLIVLPLE